MDTVEFSVSPEELRRRKQQLRERKYSFIELIMQVKKKIHQEQIAARKRARRKASGRDRPVFRDDGEEMEFKQGAD